MYTVDVLDAVARAIKSRGEVPLFSPGLKARAPSSFKTKEEADAEKVSSLRFFFTEQCNLNPQDAQEYAEHFMQEGVDAVEDLFQFYDGELAWPPKIKILHLKKMRSGLEKRRSRSTEVASARWTEPTT